MPEDSFATVWGLSYSDFEFLSSFGKRSRVMIGYQLLHFRQHGNFPCEDDLILEALKYISDQVGVSNDPGYSLSSDTARRHRSRVLSYLGIRRATIRDRTSLQDWMVINLGGRNLKLAEWVDRGFSRALAMGFFVPSEKIMDRLARAARRSFREGFLQMVAARVLGPTEEKLEQALLAPLDTTGFQRLKDGVGAATLKNILAAADRVRFVESLTLPMDLMALPERD